MSGPDNLTRFIDEAAPREKGIANYCETRCKHIVNEKTEEVCGQQCYKELDEKHGGEHACMGGHIW